MPTTLPTCTATEATAACPLLASVEDFCVGLDAELVVEVDELGQVVVGDQDPGRA